LQLSIFNWFKKEEVRQVEVVQPAVEIPVTPNSQSKQPKPKKPRKPKVKKEKPAVNAKVEPKVDILKFEFDPANPRLGSIELDWNSEFVELLVNHGYLGNSEEEIVDKWLNDVCRTIIANQFPGTNTSVSAATLVNRKNLGEGKTEIS
jgi:hypothetical protein